MSVRPTHLFTCLRCLLCALALLCPLAQAGEWFELGGAQQDAATDAPADDLLEADLDSLHAQGAQRSLVLRLSLRPPRQMQGHAVRSVQATLRLSCDGASAFWKEARFFSEEKGGGMVLFEQVYGPPQGPGLALERTDWLPPARWNLLRKSACAEAATVMP